MKKIREGYKITEFGEIPEEWDIGSIDELTTFIKSGLSRNLKDENVGIPCIRSNNIVNGRINYNDLKYWFLKDDKGANIEDYILNDGDVLVNFINSMAQIGKTCIYRSNGRDAIYTTNIFRVNFNKDKILNEYFYYFSQTDRYKKEIELITKPAVNQASFTTVDFKKIKLAIPIIKEQERIVSILSTVDEQIDNVDALIEKNKELKKGLMQTLLTKGIGHTKFKKTEIGEIPEEWNIFKLSDCATIIDSLHETPEYSEYGFPMIRVVDVNGKAINTKLTNKVCETIYKKFTKKYEPKQGDIIMSRVGSYGLVSYLKDSERVCLGQNIVIITTELCKKYLFYVLSSEYVKNNIEKVTVGSSQKTLSLANINELKILIPSIKEQNKISLILSDIDEKIEKYENKKQKLEELKKGLMQQLLSGQIRVNID